MKPVPSRPTVEAPVFARYLAARPAAAPTRRLRMCPSLMSASRLPFSRLNKSSKPRVTLWVRWVPGVRSRRKLPLRSCQKSLSVRNRMAAYFCVEADMVFRL